MKKIVLLIATVVVAIMFFIVGCTNETADPLYTTPISPTETDAQSSPSITVVTEKIEELPADYAKAYINVSHVGDNPRFIVYDNLNTTFYVYNRSTAECYKGVLSLPEGYSNGKIVAGIRGAGSGEIYLVIKAECGGAEEYIQYDLTGWYPECATAFECFLYFPDKSTAGGAHFIETVEKQAEQLKSDKCEKESFPSASLLKLQIETEKVGKIPFVPEYALFDVSPVGDFPRYIQKDFGLTFYYYNWHLDSMSKCTIMLPGEFTYGQIVHTMRGAGSGEVEFYVLANHQNGYSYYILLSFYGWGEAPTSVSARILNRFDEDDASLLSELSRLMGEYDAEQHSLFIELENKKTPDRGGVYFPLKTTADSVNPDFLLYTDADYSIYGNGMSFCYTDSHSGEVNKYVLPLPARFINGKILRGEVDEDGFVHLYVMAEYLGKNYYIDYYFSYSILGETVGVITVDVIVLNGEDPSDADKIADLEAYHY